MTHDEINRIAQEAKIDALNGFRDDNTVSLYYEAWPEQLERFATIVFEAAYTKGQEDMRERCVKLCESMEYEFKAGHECAAAIHAMPMQKGGEA